MNSYDLHNRTAIVTGGASGLGLGAAERLLTSGARVALWDVNAQQLDQAAGELARLGRVETSVVDVADYQSVENAAEATAQALGKAHILVNSAGINRPPAPIAEASLRDWDDVIAIDLTGVFYCCRAVIPQMIEQAYGRVVNISSVAGKEGNEKMIGYSAAKAGVIALTKSLGKELASAGVIVNCITPTMFDTPMNRKTSKAAPEQIQALLERIPLGRRGEIHEFASMVAWLCSEECSFTTGAVFDLSGGRTSY